MYAYDTHDQAFVEDRAREFRDQVERRLTGQLSEEEFRPLRLQNGLYLQLHAYMLRIAIPYGELNSTQLRKLGYIADTYDKGYGHFTTRQNIQFNWPKLVDTPDILDHLASVQMHAIQTSGNCIRNVTSDPFAGVAADEFVDPRPVSELLRQWSMLHPEFAFLPRKFKFAVTGAAEDRAAMKFHDIGIWAKTDDSGNPVFDLYVGGGQGRTPRVAKLFEEAVALPDLLPLLDAMLRVYNLHGRRDNKYKARIKILVEELGLESYRDEVRAELARMDTAPFQSAVDEYERIRAQFEASQPDMEPAESLDLSTASAGLQAWIGQNVAAHRVPGWSVVQISVKPKGGIPGDVTGTQMQVLADLADAFSAGELRITHRQNVVFPYVRAADLPGLYKGLQDIGLAEDNIGEASDIIACPGLDYCGLATARSIPVAQELSTMLREREATDALGPISLNISGCINACGHHHAANIGILGLNKAEKENYQITLGGRSDENAAVGEVLGPGFDRDQVPAAIGRVLDTYLSLRTGADERFPDTYARVGKAPFKEAVYVGA
jgi:sulfite reductase (NADPH) hemoprotein beta-component